MRFQFLGGGRAGRFLSVLRGHSSGSSGAQLLHVTDLCIMLLSSLRGFTKWIQRSADPRSNDMKIQGGEGEGGAKACQISRKSMMVTLFLMLEYIGGKGGGA